MRKPETTDERAERRDATDALRLHPNTRYVTCPIHGARGHVVDVFSSNLAYWDESDGLRCVPDHPGCFDWFNRTEATNG